MRHKCGYRALGRPSDHRRAMLRNLATSFLREGRCETTVARAKELRPIVERLITIGRQNSLHSRRKAYSYLFDKKVVQKLFDEIAPRFQSRPGGYTRIVKHSLPRHGDCADTALIELVD